MKFLVFIVGVFAIVSCNRTNTSVLNGMWELDIIEAKDSLGVWQEASWMQNGTGLLHYGNNEYMSVHFWPDTAITPNQEPYWYVAQYKTIVDTVFHKRMMHSIPVENFKTAVRLYTIKQDTLYLSAPDYGFRLTWIKK